MDGLRRAARRIGDDSCATGLRLQVHGGVGVLVGRVKKHIRRRIDLGQLPGVCGFGQRQNLRRKLFLLFFVHAHQHDAHILAQLLCQKTGMKKVFFCNSGAEANECAIKVARKYAADKKGSDCYTIITLENSFHGRTLTTLAATGQDHYHELFQPLTPGFVHARANDIDHMQQLCQENSVAAILLECVQGEGGVNVLDKEYVQAVAKLAQEQDILLMVDEVQTGNGRSGKLYAYMHYGIQPDVVSTAKGLGGGLPLGATLLGEKVEAVLGFGDHGSTFGGNPVCCAGALSILNRLDDAFLADVQRKSEAVFAALTGAEGIESVCGLGLMIGIQTKKPASEVVKACMEKGVLCLTAKNKVRLLPALNIPMDILMNAISIIKEACV